MEIENTYIQYKKSETDNYFKSMKKKYFSPCISLYDIVEAETILAASEPKFKPSVNEFEDDGEEELQAETYTASGASTSAQP